MRASLRHNQRVFHALRSALRTADSRKTATLPYLRRALIRPAWQRTGSFNLRAGYADRYAVAAAVFHTAVIR